jgi:hypothetical protein
MIRVLLVAPDQPGISSISEVRTITALLRVTVLNGTVTAQDIYSEARHGKYDVLHVATHSEDHAVHLSGGETLSPEDVAQVARLCGAQLILFNSCRSGLMAAYAVAHDVPAAIYCNVELLDREAWKLPLSFYSLLAEQDTALGVLDIASAFHGADTGEGLYGMLVRIDQFPAAAKLAVEMAEQRTKLAQIETALNRMTQLAGMLLIMWLIGGSILLWHIAATATPAL